MKQMTMEEWISKQTKVDGWERIVDSDHVVRLSGPRVLLPVHPVTKSSLMKDPDVVCEGIVNGVPAWIGFKEWVSGWGSCYKEYELLQWKERKEA